MYVYIIITHCVLHTKNTNIRYFQCEPPTVVAAISVAPTCASTLAPLDTRSSNRATFPSLAAAKISSFAPQSAVFLSHGGGGGGGE